MTRSTDSPTGWVDPMTPADWARERAWSETLRRRALERDREARSAARRPAPAPRPTAPAPTTKSTTAAGRRK